MLLHSYSCLRLWLRPKLLYAAREWEKSGKKGEELWVIASSFPFDWSDQSVSCNGIVYLPDKALRARQADLCRWNRPRNSQFVPSVHSIQQQGWQCAIWIYPVSKKRVAKFCSLYMLLSMLSKSKYWSIIVISLNKSNISSIEILLCSK